MSISDIFRENASNYLKNYGNKIPSNHIKAINDIINCRTSAMGGEVYFCEKCKKYHYSYHSCKNRHCPKCGSGDSEKWLKRQVEKLLPAQYFMVTFTLPEELRFICRSNQKLFYTALFNASSNALKTLLNDPKFAGGIAGFVGILHTWTRQLHYHPHIHFIVPGGAFDSERNCWNRANGKFLVPVEALSIIFRAKFRDFLKVKSPEIFKLIPQNIWYDKEFITNSQSVGKGEKAIKYLSNYVYRTAITNNRIVRSENGKVTFKYKESGSNKIRYQTVTALEFMRRFLQHVLPVGFQKVRYYGFLSSASKVVWQQICNYFDFKPTKTISSNEVSFNKRESSICPDCKSEMIHCGTILRNQRAPPDILFNSRSIKNYQQTV